MENKEVDLFKLLKVLNNNKKILFKSIALFFILGVFIALSTPKEYTASTTIITQTSGSKNGGLSNLAAMAGLGSSIGTGTDIEPILYPEIIKSILYKKELTKTILDFPEIKESITFTEYYTKYKKKSFFDLLKAYTIGLPSKIINFFKKEQHKSAAKLSGNHNFISITKEENTLFKIIDKQLKVNYNKKNGYVKITYSMPSALASVQMLANAKKQLQQTIIDVKTKKEVDKLNFIRDQYLIKKKEIEDLKIKIALYRDSNRGFITSISKAKLEEFESEYNFRFGVFSELAKQLETQKIKVKESTPIFSEINPASIPYEKSKPKVLAIIVFYVLIGGAIGVFLSLRKIIYNFFQS